eukprot:763866-Hanusia_phi.AAC.8
MGGQFPPTRTTSHSFGKGVGKSASSSLSLVSSPSPLSSPPLPSLLRGFDMCSYLSQGRIKFCTGWETEPSDHRMFKRILPFLSSSVCLSDRSDIGRAYSERSELGPGPRLPAHSVEAVGPSGSEREWIRPLSGDLKRRTWISSGNFIPDEGANYNTGILLATSSDERFVLVTSSHSGTAVHEPCSSVLLGHISHLNEMHRGHQQQSSKPPNLAHAPGSTVRAV